MGFKQYLISLKWNTFARYPAQGESIYLHCESLAGEHKFIIITDFNAVLFKPEEIYKKLRICKHWQLSWLPTKQVEQHGS